MATREVDLGSIMGPQGVQGETGPTGPKGEDGATWLSGIAAPSAQGKDGDYYINTSNGDVYKRASGAWTKTGNIKGTKGDKGDKGDTGAQGPVGPEGAKGDPFTIAKTYVSIAAMNAGYATDGVKQGQFILIDTGNVEDEDNAKLYVKGETAYSYITDLSGAKGMTGPQGPKGATGTQGPQGIQGIKGDTGAAGAQGPKGDKGVTGAQGPKGDKGEPGATPTLEIRNGHLIAIYPE